MEAEYTPAWSSIMDNAVRNLISESERDTNALCKQLDLDLLQGFYSVGIDKARVASMVNISAANRGNVIRDSFASMRELAQENQRELSRSLLPKVQQSLKQSYNNTLSVTGMYYLFIIYSVRGSPFMTNPGIHFDTIFPLFYYFQIMFCKKADAESLIE